MSRTTQPYRKGAGRPKGRTLDAMTAGRGVYGNPMDVKRKAQRASRRPQGAVGMSRVLRARLGR